MPLCHQLADTRDLERGALDGLAQEFEVFCPWLRVERVETTPGAGNADVDDRVALRLRHGSRLP